MDVGRKGRLVRDLCHDSLPCPARGLELVVYSEHVAGEPTAEPGFELELHTGSTTGANGQRYVLNACRALRYLAEGRWSSKAEAGRWALDHAEEAELVAAALRARKKGDPLPALGVREFLAGTVGRLERCSA